MRVILTIILTLSFSQTEKDLTEIIELVIKKHQTDTIMVYHKFDNYELLLALDGAKSYKDNRSTRNIKQN